MVTVNNRDRLEWKEGMTVQDVLDQLGYEYVLITVVIDGEVVPRIDYPSHRVPDGSDVTVFHLAHGG